MADAILKFQIVGRKEDNGDLRFDDFIKQLGLIKKALSEIDRLISTEKTMYYRVADLSHNSPYTLSVIPEPFKDKHDISIRLVNTFMGVLTSIQYDKTVSEEVDSPTLQAFKELVGPLQKQEISELYFSQNGQFVPVSPDIGETVDKIIGPDELEEGSVVGDLHQLNLHLSQNVFTVYPTSGHPKVTCHFPRSLRDKVIDAVDHYVEVYGTLRYRSRDKFPYAMTAKEIEVYPPEDELPTLMDLHGIAPNIIGNRSSEHFVRSLRDE